ncbi:hypothetical protein X766_26155 [Mesorhizobium sp. LSJC255A00]|nr:hypothetical protein X766_26155 [Mesorhizobium sp. LSJC255A00]
MGMVCSAKPPLPNSSPPLSTLAQESLAGGGSNAHRADFVLTSKVQDNVPHLAARSA